MDDISYSIRTYFGACLIKKDADDIELICEHYTERQDHYMCGHDGCDCEDSQGWCDNWYDDCEVSSIKDFEEYVQDTFDEETHEKYVFDAQVDEKGTLYMTVSRKIKKLKV